MFQFFGSPWAEFFMCSIGAILASFFAYGEIPPKVSRKTGKRKGFSNRFQETSRLGKVALLVAVLMSIASFLVLLDLLEL